MAFDDPPEAEPDEFEMAMFYLRQGQKPSEKEVKIICDEVEAMQRLIKDLQQRPSHPKEV